MTPALNLQSYPIKHSAEYQTALRLELQLPATYQVFHSVYWSTHEVWGTMVGEIDFIVMAPSGRLLMVEQKNGALIETDEGLKKKYHTQEKSIVAQVNRSHANLLSAFQRVTNQKLDIEFLLYCPDYQVINRHAAGLAGNRIVDQTEDCQLSERIQSILNERPLAKSHFGDTLRIEDFLISRLGVRYDFTAVGNAAKTAYISVASGLSRWVGKLEGAPLKLLINATAGSGKTQLALDEIQAAKQAGLGHLYVCFNRMLADDMKARTGFGDSCVTFHELARTSALEAGHVIELDAPDAFGRLADLLISLSAQLQETFDVMVIDEAQDFEGAWLQALFGMIKPHGRLIVLQDQNQALYARQPADYSGFVQLYHNVSYRCPSEVIAVINGEELADYPIESQSPIDGFETLHETYASESECEAATERMIDRMLKLGHATEDIVVLTVHGAQNSRLISKAKIGRHTIRHPDGRNPDGSYKYTDGDILMDTVFRFKGRSANCVILTELDFVELDEKSKRRLFVGLTRARLQVGLVMASDAFRMGRQ